MDSTRSSPAKGYFVAAVLAGAYGLNFLDRQLLSILAEPVKADLGLTDTQLGLLSGFAFAIVYTLFGIPVAWMADRGNRVRIVVAACGLWSLFTSVCGLAQNFTHLALARIGVGIGEAGGSPPSYSIIADYFPPERRAGALAIYSLGVPIGTTAGAALGGWIAAEHGWRWAFMAVGALGVVYSGFILLVVREPKRGGNDKASVKSASFADTAKLFIREPKLTLTAVAASFSSLIGYAMLSWTPALLMRVKGMTLGELASYYSVASGVTAAIGTVLSGYLVDRLGQRDKRMYGFIPAIAFLVAAPFYAAGIYAQSWQMTLLFMTVPFALYASYLPPALAIVQNTVAPSQRSTASAILLFILGIFALGGGPLLIGSISDALLRQGHAFPLQFAMYALFPIFFLASLGHAAVARAMAGSENAEPGRAISAG
ncbi:spinster family MFS transporter [Novosphingobium lindaniclasticum]|uniref:spinster family MFS transporter n=1 Tax=Novosphingobium lindaniclasticum TaxID=1329895 RepID=UPI000408C1B2|nr:MFS transporter [Novosphingobium lindaniclasticum]